MTYYELKLSVINWANKREIIENSTALAQSIKTLEEVAELQSALSKKNMEEAADAYGDVLREP